MSLPDCPSPYFVGKNNKSLEELVTDANNLGKRALELVNNKTLTPGSLKRAVRKIIGYHLTSTPAAIIVKSITKVWG